MHDVVPLIFKTLGGSTAIANGIGSPVQTVNDWLKKGKPEIPPWRRAAVLAFAKRKKLLAEMPPECLEYLNSQERTVATPTPREAA